MLSRLTPIAGLLGVVALVATLTSPASSQPDAATDGRDPVARPAAGEITSVVAISIDALNPRAIRKLGKDGAPTLNRLIAEGASTLDARTEYELTVTLPNHTGMVTGRRIDPATGGHGVTWNDDRLQPPTVQAAAGGPVSSVFEVVDDAGASAALFASKTKFSLWQRSWPDAIDLGVIDLDTRSLTRKLVSDLRLQTRAFRFLHLADPDTVGHAKGFMSPAYLDAVRRSDRLVRKVVRTIRRDPDLAGHTAIVLTADHGGARRALVHSDQTKPANYTVPFVVWGPGVEAGADLYDLNPDFADPGRGRPTYAAAEQPVRNGDVANLSLDLLGLAAVPSSEHDLSQTLDWNRD